jgi:opacity protein-like surface antigen
MKKLLFIMMPIVSIQIVSAQEKESFKRFYINGGTNLSVFNPDNKLNNGYLGFEYKFLDESSIGLNLSYTNLTYNTSSGYSLGDPKKFGFQFQFNHDWSKNIGLNTNKFDVYTGLGLGLSFFESKNFKINDQSYGGSDTNFNFGGQMGLRYFITKSIGINTELNFSTEKDYQLKTGLTYRF